MRMTPERLEKGYRWAYEEFYSCASILCRSLGLPNALKRIAYNMAWKKADRVWAEIIRHGLLPFVRPLFERVLARDTRSANAEAVGSPLSTDVLPRKDAQLLKAGE